MFAVLQEGGKQYHVQKGDVIRVETIDGDIGSKIKLNHVMAVGDKIGTPTLKGASVEAEILEQKRLEKIIVFKFKRRKGYKRTKGHRQSVTVLRIGKIAAK